MTITFPTLERAGRLGNQLWQMASTLGIARMEGQEPAFPPGWSYRPFFSVPDRYFDSGPGTPAYASRYAAHLDPKARQYLQDLALWAHVEAEVRAWFQPSSWALELLISEPVWAILPHAIALHVRRGDNVYQPEWYWLPTLRYYERALAELPEAPIVVFSDDVPWCRAELHAVIGCRQPVFYEGMARPKEHEPHYMTAPILDWKDLLLMAQAKYHVISNSTYAWWGAWLSQDPAPIYPARWYGPANDFADPRRMFTPAWRMVEP